MKIRCIESRDADQILQVQDRCPEIAPWTLQDYQRAADGEMAGWVADEGGIVVGFLVARRVAHDFEILNFAVRPDVRQKGIGSLLLQQSFAWGTSLQAENAFLEVRASNLAAQRFYERRGFRITGRRPRYYSSPEEDALLLTATISPQRQGQSGSL